MYAGPLEGTLDAVRERDSRSEDRIGPRLLSTKPSGAVGGCGGRARRATAPSCRCAVVPPSTARIAFGCRSRAGSSISRARAARRVANGSRPPEPNLPWYDTWLSDWALRLPCRGFRDGVLLPLEIRWFDAPWADVYRAAADIAYGGDQLQNAP